MIKERFLTPNPYSRPRRKLVRVNGIVLHYVGVPYQKAEQTVQYFENLKDGKNNTYASAHYVIGLDGDGINCIPISEMAYHCGAKTYKPGIEAKLGGYPNSYTIGVELCHTDKGFTKETLESAEKLVAMLCAQFGLTEEDIYRHYDITGKNCPMFMVKNPTIFKKFKDKVWSYLN